VRRERSTFCPDVNVTNCPAGNCCGRSDQSGKQTVRPEHQEMAAACEKSPAVKSLLADGNGKPTHLPLGKADDADEATGKSNLQTVVAEAQASQERLSGITSGRSWWQQGLVATCTDSSNEATNRRRGEPHGIGA